MNSKVKILDTIFLYLHIKKENLTTIYEGTEDMRTILVLFLIAILSIPTVAKENFYDLQAEINGGETLNFSDFKGKKLMIVNTASYCGYTKQYEDLQKLYEKYAGTNFEIIAFPANNFSNQEPGSDEEIKKFCEDNFSITFTLMAKISVRGEDMHPVYQWLTQKDNNGVKDSEVMWNFQKYLITEHGELHEVLSTQTNPMNPLIFNWIEEPSSISNEDHPAAGFSIYPNPASNYIDISYQISHTYDIHIYNAFGECKIAEQISLSYNKIDISNLPAGVYFLMIGNYVEKFVKI